MTGSKPVALHALCPGALHILLALESGGGPLMGPRTKRRRQADVELLYYSDVYRDALPGISPHLHKPLEGPGTILDDVGLLAWRGYWMRVLENIRR